METLKTLGPSQVRYPAKAVLRTLVQIVITLATVVPWLISALNDAAAGTTFGPQLAAAGVQVLAVAGVVTRFMAVPGINDALTRWGLGARPAGAPPVVVAQQAPQIPAAAPDPDPAPVTPEPVPEALTATEPPYGRHAQH